MNEYDFAVVLIVAYFIMYRDPRRNRFFSSDSMAFGGGLLAVYALARVFYILYENWDGRM